VYVATVHTLQRNNGEGEEGEEGGGREGEEGGGGEKIFFSP
jgi:hypothetical protein